MDPKEFYGLCAKHDWYYEFSDDSRVWREGKANRGKLFQLKHGNETLEAIFKAWEEYITSPVESKKSKPTLESLGLKE